MSVNKVILIKILRKKKELRKNKERRMFYILYFLIIFLRIVELLSILYFRSPSVSCWIALLHLVHAPRIERKTLREVVLSITNKRMKECWRKRIKCYTRLHKAAVVYCATQKKVNENWLHNGYTSRRSWTKFSINCARQEGYTSRSRSWAPLRMYCAWNLRNVTKKI